MTSASDRSTATRHSFLIILRFNREDLVNPLRPGLIDEGEKFKRLHPYQATLVVGVVDPSLRSAMTPMMMIPMDKSTLKTYDKILRGVEELNSRYRGENGYLRDPMSFNQTESSNVIDKIRFIGDQIYGLLKSSEDSDAVMKWLDDRFRRYARRDSAEDEEHITIVTNDFSIPWYWLSLPGREYSLCEIVALGMLQLSSYTAGYKGDADSAWRARVAQENLYKALLVNGSPTLPFARSELEAVKRGLSAPQRNGDAAAAVQTEEIESRDMLVDLRKRTPYGERIERYRIVHFTGHYSSEALMIGDDAIEPREELDQFIDRSVLVLDGCSSSKGLRAWTDMDTVTGRLIQVGAVGCIVTALPLKNDPLIAEWFWPTFYDQIRQKGVSVGQALRRARAALKDQLEQLGLYNPAWLLYQLVGNPTVDLFTEFSDWAGPR